MSIRRIAFISYAALLGLGATGGSVALAGANIPPAATSPASTTPTVTSSAGTFTVTFPGVGSLSFAVDTTTGAVSSLTVTPVDGSGVTASVPTATRDGVKVVFTSATSTQVLEVKVVRSPSGPIVKAEVDVPDHATGEPGDHSTPGGPPAVGADQEGHPVTTAMAEDRRPDTTRRRPCLPRPRRRSPPQRATATRPAMPPMAPLGATPRRGLRRRGRLATSLPPSPSPSPSPTRATGAVAARPTQAPTQAPRAPGTELVGAGSRSPVR